MTLHVCYDITRLITRILNKTPNGIDRLDMAYASHFLGDTQNHSSGLVHLTSKLPRALNRLRSRGAIDAISQHLGEEHRESSPSKLPAIMSWISGTTTEKPVFRSPPPSPMSYPKVANFYWRYLGVRGASPKRLLPQGSTYLCVSQYPLSESGAFGWLDERPDIKPVFFIHDMLPLEYPEYFKPPEQRRHEIRMQNLARYGAAALVTTQVMKQALSEYMKKLGRGTMPIHVAPVPLAPAFYNSKTTHAVTGPDYFVMCSTIEPRKNHLMVLNSWRSMVKEAKTSVPKLILVGSRGWENENVIDMLERSPAVRQNVLEVNGLSTPDLVNLMLGARAVLMPSFAEGFGLPVAEALSLGVPVLASDIPVFQEIASGKFTAINPMNGEAWTKHILAARNTQLPRPRFSLPRPDEAGYFDKLNAFLGSL